MMKKKFIMATAIFATAMFSNLVVSGPKEDEEELKKLFSSVKFLDSKTQKPLSVCFGKDQNADVTISFSQLIKAPRKNNKSNKNLCLEIHFRDAEHLLDINKQYLESDVSQIYFVWDKNVKIGEELLLSNGTKPILLKTINIESEFKAKLEGKLISDYSLYMPSGFDFRTCDIKLSGINGAKIDSGKRSLQTNSSSLSSIISSFGKDVKTYNRDTEASKIIESYDKDRIYNPKKYSDLIEQNIKHDISLFYDDKVEFYNRGDIASKSPIIYFANSVGDFKKLKKMYHSFGHYPACCLNNDIKGVFSETPLYLSEGFTIKALGNLIAIGSIKIPNYNLEIKSKKNLVSGMGIEVFNISIIVGKKLTLYGTIIEPVIEFINTRRPIGGVPVNLWAMIANKFLEMGIIKINTFDFDFDFDSDSDSDSE